MYHKFIFIHYLIYNNDKNKKFGYIGVNALLWVRILKVNLVKPFELKISFSL